MANSFLITNPTPKASINIINPFMAFNTVFPYTITAGAGDIEVTNSTDFPYLGKYSQKVRFLDSGTMSFNAGNKTTTIIKETGLHNFQFQVRSEDTEISCNFKVEVFLNGSLSTDRTFETAVKEAEGFEIGKWNIFYQSFFAEEGDEITISWTCINTEANTTFYVDGYKIDCINQQMTTPTIYTVPFYLGKKITEVYDFDNSQTLTENVQYNFTVSGVTNSNCDDEILYGNELRPTRQDALYTVNVSFLATVPSSGTNHHIDCEMIIAGVTVKGYCQFLQKPSLDTQYMNFTFNKYVDETFLLNQGTITVTARGADIKIEKKIITVTETLNFA